MENAESGELFDLIADRCKLLELEAINFVLQKLPGIEYCHNNLISSLETY